MQKGNQKYPNTLGLYIHVPFCSSTCDFCAFYQERPSKKKIEGYFLSLNKEIESTNFDREISTVFIGGGTPGILKSEELDELCALINSLKLKRDIEWTIEIAPNEITTEKLSVLANAGVNRISLGVQTFDPKLMKALGRDHGPQKVHEAHSRIIEYNFDSVNFDLIFGIPGQTLEMWERDMLEAVELEPDHISTYCLTFEEDTSLYYRLAKGELSIDQEKEAQFYERAWELLPSKGYQQYEVSNFARPSYECVHNVNTWEMNEWIGLGPSACSQFNGKRWKNPSNLEKWAEGISNGFSPKDYDEFQVMTLTGFAEDALLFGLRMNDGVCLSTLGERFHLSSDYLDEVRDFVSKLQAEGLAVKNEQRIMLTLQGRVRADAIAVEMPEYQIG